MEVACKPDSGIGAKPKLVDHPVPLVIDVTKVHRVVSPWSISVWAFHFWASEIKVER
jgi:hypothetical protein